ncbi:hypothetical protein KQX54_000524, partial [Cotesia glomerata]
VFIGNDQWVTEDYFATMMASSKISTFIDYAARYIFGDEILLKSTVSGRRSNRSKKINQGPVQKLDPISMEQTRSK